MSKAREIASSENVSGFKNLIINGGFDIWQRGESFDDISGYTADMVRTGNTTDGAELVEKSEVNGSNSIKFTITTAPTDMTGTKYLLGLFYVFEGQTLYSLAIKGKTLTLSFMFNSNITGTYSVSFRNGTDANNYESYVKTFEYITTNEPQKVQIQIDLNYQFNTTPRNDNAKGFGVIIGFLNKGDHSTNTEGQWISGNYCTSSSCVNWASAVDNFIEIAELQLEEGEVATPFEQRPIGLELSLCQRYYVTGTGVFHSSYADAQGTNRLQTVHFPTTMRTAPTVTVIETASTNTDEGTLAVSTPRPNQFQSQTKASGSGRIVEVFDYTADASI